MKTQLKEILVFGIDLNKYEGSMYNLSNEEFMELSEKHGFVYSLSGFASAHNKEEVPYDLWIRFIAVPNTRKELDSVMLNQKQEYLEIYK